MENQTDRTYPLPQTGYFFDFSQLGPHNNFSFNLCFTVNSDKLDFV